MNDIAILSRGAASEPDRSLFDRQVLSTVRYADPAAWTVAAAVYAALAPVRDRLEPLIERTGIIGISARPPVEATAAIRQAAAEGFPSPLRYPAANPGSLIGVSCIAFGFRGPTLCLLMEPEPGVQTGLTAAGQWVARRAAEAVVLAVCRQEAEGGASARAVILGPAAASGDVPRDEAGAWLLQKVGTSNIERSASNIEREA
ncbi:MAG: hypothetical protein JW951_06345 [Lentisphaerae bacterium]|nr:hypothetical protein [Lentisphaerota bacterium]